MQYSPDGEGLFAGQHGYGYISIEKFVTTVRCSLVRPGGAVSDHLDVQCQAVNAGTVNLADLDARLPTIYSTIVSTAILEAGRISLNEKRSIGIIKDGDAWSLQ